jgi:hypothetical protein
MTNLTAEELRLAEHVRRGRPRLGLALASFVDGGSDPLCFPMLLTDTGIRAALTVHPRETVALNLELLAVEVRAVNRFFGGVFFFDYAVAFRRITPIRPRAEPRVD